jgi:hypothetical protein
MGNFFGSLYNRTPVNRFRNVEDYLPLFVGDPLRFEPGSRCEYSNAGFILRGYLIERVSGRDYHELVRDNVFDRAGMKNTDCHDVQFPVPDLDVGYTRSPSSEYGYKTIEFMEMTRGGPAGGGYSAVGDLIRFGEALFGNRLLNEHSTDLATTAKVEVGDTWQGGEYAFGLLEQKINGHRIVGHSGNFAGTRATLEIHVDDGISLAVLSDFNRDQCAKELEYFIRERINGPTPFTSKYLRTKEVIRRIERDGGVAVIDDLDRAGEADRLCEGIINSRGYLHLRFDRFEAAIELFRFNASVFPESANAHDSLAEACLCAGDRETAIEHCTRALEIEPGMESAGEDPPAPDRRRIGRGGGAELRVRVARADRGRRGRPARRSAAWPGSRRPGRESPGRRGRRDGTGPGRRRRRRRCRSTRRA